MSYKGYRLVSAIIALLTFILAFVLVYSALQPKTYELVTRDGITIMVDGHCETQYSPVFVDDDFGFVKCNGEYYYGIESFREIK